MARTTKTKIGEHDRQYDREIRAAAQGSAQRSRAQEQLTGQRTQGVQQGMQMGQMAAGMAESGERMERQDRSLDISQSRLNLEAARSGFVPEGDPRAAQMGGQPGAQPAPGQMGPPASAAEQRAQQLDQEMDRGAQQGVAQRDPEEQQRTAEQASQGVEFDGQTWVPSQSRVDAQRTQQATDAYKAQTARIRAEAYRAQVASQYEKAQVRGDKEAMASLKDKLRSPIQSGVNRLNRMMEGKAKPGDWEQLRENAPPDPELQADLEAKQMTPRVRQHIETKTALDSLRFIASTGDIPSGELVDFSSPIMQAFTERANKAKGLLQSAPHWGQIADIKSYEEKVRFLNHLAARELLATGGGGLGTQFQPQGALGGMPPSAGGMAGPGGPEQQQQASGFGAQGQQDPSVDVSPQPYATDEATQRAIEARAAGQNVPPTDTPQFRRQYGDERGLETGSQLLNAGFY